ncbi:hypothetical protein EYC84_003617 [Monilinia fructicola]|uniref:Septum-promoting GTP-binding protein 1 n=1 Tax=Monilinia fructicola TaxID=38448 RepID=A0A5M9JY54_MONFR|nr:hypothetical protein EYC84_003617 [Monilinia fructicola]
MVKYVEGSWDEDYIQTLGVNFMEKTISIRNTEITFSIWDLGGQREFVNMLPLVCNDAVAILFMFDLTRKSTLNSIKEWYRQGRGFNKTAIPFLVGTKYDHFVNFPREDQEEISNQARRFAKAMRASLIFSSTSHSINVQKIFKIVLSKAFDLKCTIPEIENVGEPLLLYQSSTHPIQTHTVKFTNLQKTGHPSYHTTLDNSRNLAIFTHQITSHHTTHPLGMQERRAGK